MTSLLDPSTGLPDGSGELRPGGIEPPSLHVLLLRLVAIATQAVTGADGVGVALHAPEGGVQLTTDQPFVRRVHDAQYALTEGPCLQGTLTRRIQRSENLANDHRWPRFGIRASRMGINSALSLPLITPHRVLGSLAVYSHTAHAFDADDERISGVFAALATSAAHRHPTNSDATHLTSELRAALAERTIIGRAIGILQVRGGDTAMEASRRLTMLSRHLNSTLVDTAAVVVGSVESGGNSSPRADGSSASFSAEAGTPSGPATGR